MFKLLTDRFLVAGVIALSLEMTGCFFGAPAHETGTLEGVVKAGGQPVSGCDINFFAAETGTGMNATLTPDGTYAIRDKIWTGNYVVYFTPPLPEPEVPGQPAKAPNPQAGQFQKLVPAKYRVEAATPLTAVVHEGKNVLNFELTP